MFRCATVSRAELEELRRVKNIVRLGRVSSIDANKVTLDKGNYPPVQDTVYIDCAADGVRARPPVPVFSPSKIVLQPVRYCRQVFSAAFIAHVEATYDDEKVKNELCRPVMQPNAPIDMLVVSYQDNVNAIRWCLESKTLAWLRNCRLDYIAKTWEPLLVGDPEEREAARQKYRAQRSALCDKLRELLRAEPEAEAKLSLSEF